ncbi:AHH domain-containing protein, partial [Pyxidicoccus sp. 3LG]
TKAAAVMSAVMVVYLGVGPFLSLVRASFQLKQATDRARTFEELEVAGARFGRVMGTEGTQVAILALAALLGQGTAGMSSSVAARMRMLPAFEQAAALGEAQVGLRLAAVGEVSSVAVTTDGTLVVALPATAVAMVAMGSGGIQGDPDGKVHHICTDKNDISDSNGGPWTPLFEPFFNKAGMSLTNAPANQVRIRGHEGPHPEAYHTAVYERVREAVAGCRGTAQCRDALVEALRGLARELLTPGSKLRHLVTKGQGE